MLEKEAQKQSGLGKMVITFKAPVVQRAGGIPWDWLVKVIASDMSPSKSAKLLKTGKTMKVCKLLRIGTLLKYVQRMPLPVRADELLCTSRVQGRLTFGLILVAMTVFCH